MADLYPDVEYLQYEEDVLRNPYSLKLWWRYLIAMADAPSEKRRVIYERALKYLPGSYKIWRAYLLERLEWVRSFPITDSRYTHLNNTFERALVTMHKMPRIWIMYLEVLIKQKLVTATRRTFDRALCALPVSHHDRIWGPFMVFISQKEIPIETSRRVYRRFLIYDPIHVEEYIDFLKESELWQEAAERLGGVLNDDHFSSIKGKTKHELWLELCDLFTEHAEHMGGFNVDAIVRVAIRRFTDKVGTLWTALAVYYMRRQLFEKARDVFEEGMNSVTTVRDFSVIFDSYAQFEETVISARMETISGDSESDMSDEDDNPLDVDRLKKCGSFWFSDEAMAKDLDLRLARLEHLINRRPELVNNVMLRQNPHSVEQWHCRVKLYEGNPTKQILTYTEAVRTVDPMKAVGKPHTLWVAFAKLYERHNDIANAMVIFDKAVQVNYKTVDHLVSVWCEWAEMELRHKNFNTALDLIRRATVQPSLEIKQRVAADGDGNEPVQMKIHKSLRLWTFYADLEERLGSLDSTCAVYDMILDLGIATPQIILNYALLLEDRKYFEDAFRVYERGVKIFEYPHAKDIWITYLSKFVTRYRGSKLERSRDLFEHAIGVAPAEAIKPLYLQYAKFEEDFGLAKRAMKVYDQATKAVPAAERFGIYEIYIARAAELFGVLKTGEIYQQAIESGLLGKDVKLMCMRYTDLEKSLGRIECARALYVHSSQFADPESDPEFWFKWHDFEASHGNKDTYSDMLHVKRSVAESYSQTVRNLREQVPSLNVSKNALRASFAEEEVPVKNVVAFVSAGLESSGSTTKEDIELSEGSDDCEDEEISQKDVPSAIFGSLMVKREAEDDAVGALARIKRSRASVVNNNTLRV